MYPKGHPLTPPPPGKKTSFFNPSLNSKFLIDNPKTSLSCISNVQWNYSKWVSGHHIFIICRVIEDKSIHSIHKTFLKKARTMLFVEMEQNLTITISCKNHIWFDFLKLFSQLQVIVNLPIYRKS